jgi:hypothetical protein
MIIIDSTDTGEMHRWVRCTRTHTLRDGRPVVEGGRYFILWAWDDSSCGKCEDHPNCEAGGVELAGLYRDHPSELFCAADFEPVGEEEAGELMASMIKGPRGS